MLFRRCLFTLSAILNDLKFAHSLTLCGWRFHAKAALCLKEDLPISDLGLGASKFVNVAKDFHPRCLLSIIICISQWVLIFVECVFCDISAQEVAGCKFIPFCSSQLLCGEEDMKEMGIPMGPRKKLMGYLRNQKQNMVGVHFDLSWSIAYVSVVSSVNIIVRLTSVFGIFLKQT